MAIFELNIFNIGIGVVGAIFATIYTELLLTWHKSKIVTLQKRSDEFIKYSIEYYMPLAHLVANIEGEIDPHYDVRPKILLFKLANYLSFYKNFYDKGIGFVFPKYSQECKVAKCCDTFTSAINQLVFDDDIEATNRVIKYYNKNPDILSFIEKIDTLPEYSTFESICENSEIRKNLFDYSDAFCNSITKGVTEEYRIWYKFEVRKRHTEQNINKDAKKELEAIIKLRNNVHRKNQGD